MKCVIAHHCENEKWGKKKERPCASEDMGPSTHVRARRQMVVSTLVSLATSEIKPAKFYPLYLIIGTIVLVHRQNAYFSGQLYLLSHTPVRRSGFWPLEGKSGKSLPPTQMGDISGHSTLLIYIFTTCVFSAVSSEQFFCSFLHKLHFLN